jgi:hypothetical protein
MLLIVTWLVSHRWLLRTETIPHYGAGSVFWTPPASYQTPDVSIFRTEE